MKSLRFAWFTLLFLSANLLLSCNTNNSGDDPQIRVATQFAGVFAQGIEDSWFYSCDYDESGWKPVFNDSSIEQLHDFWEIRDQDGGPLIRMQIVGILSKKGTYNGIFARYDREIQILEIVQLDYTDDTDC